MTRRAPAQSATISEGVAIVVSPENAPCALTSERATTQPLERPPLWPVLSCRRLAGFEVSTEALKGPALPPPKASFAPWRVLLVKTDVLTADEGELFQKLYGYLSDVGTHRLGSAPEHVRLTKNVVIEVCLLLVGRVQALAAEP